ncbi:hypothetical protein D9756_008987 [Leucocoprinus leucothites]|uniref:DUF6699 domain-containing protein n=1 Tax=Leucocoprinus leucothites TaxID=201217 RepID=A0A8H5FTZ1_9AGAR|nr:hypothetical protein D9756_008987 [Leucoagaricus leucothites]
MAAPLSVNKWAPGTSYGPVLTQTDLYLLNPDLEIHPILQQKFGAFRLVLNISTGQSQDGEGRGVEFTAKDEPAVLPRVDQLYIISDHSPWCTTVRNERGVTLSDVCTAIWKEYTENFVTDGEMASLSARGQEQVKRAAQAHQAQQSGQWGYAHHAVGAVRCRRVDWFKDRIFFEGMRKEDRYAQSRLGFKAPNIFIMDLTNF